MDPKKETPPVDLAAENEALRKQNAALLKSQSATSADEKLIREKVAAGLTREQAIASIKHQRAFEEKKKGAQK
jgi:hypothetical protein